MPRRTTLFLKDNLYHSYNRGFWKSPIFKHKDAKDKFLDLMLCYSRRFGVQVEAHTLLINHYHFILRQSENNKGLQSFLSRLQQGFAMYYNKKYRRTGPVFDWRYKAKLIRDDQYYANIWNYILNNPLK